MRSANTWYVFPPSPIFIRLLVPAATEKMDLYQLDVQLSWDVTRHTLLASFMWAAVVA